MYPAQDQQLAQDVKSTLLLLPCDGTSALALTQLRCGCDPSMLMFIYTWDST